MTNFASTKTSLNTNSVCGFHCSFLVAWTRSVRQEKIFPKIKQFVESALTRLKRGRNAATKS